LHVRSHKCIKCNLTDKWKGVVCIYKMIRMEVAILKMLVDLFWFEQLSGSSSWKDLCTHLCNFQNYTNVYFVYYFF